MIWATTQRWHVWVQRLPLAADRLICLDCRLERPLVAGWLTYPHHCPPRLEAR